MFTTEEGLRSVFAWGGYAILAGIVFAETGLLVGFFLPGDSLLVTAGLLSGTGTLDIVMLNVVLIPAAIIGDAVGYYIGKRSGAALLKRPDSRFFKRKYITKTQEFYAKHGGKTIILARFVPIVRTFAPTVAGIAKMPYRQFALFNVAGGALWVLSTTLLGYFLGKVFPGVKDYFEPVILGIIFLSLLPPLIEYLRNRRKARAEASESA